MNPRAQRLLPQRSLSRLVGWLGMREQPRPMIRAALRAFAKRYRVDMGEAEHGIEHYRSFTDFFTRKLRPGARPLPDDTARAVWPADGAAAAHGTVRDGRMLQAKGIDYTCAELLGDRALAERFEGGAYSTVYLSPRDYHRVHAPCAGSLRQRIHLPGRLYSVNHVTVASVPGVFAGNERVVLAFDGSEGGAPWTLVMVGALIIGGIETVWEGTVNPRPGTTEARRDFRDAALDVQRGDEVGLFRAGSTVIMLFAPDRVTLDPIELGTAVRMGEAMGRLTDPADRAPGSSSDDPPVGEPRARTARR